MVLSVLPHISDTEDVMEKGVILSKLERLGYISLFQGSLLVTMAKKY
jgi:hypothetical protein